MKKLLLLMLVVTACGRTVEPGWKLAWSDEFNNPGLPDLANWVNEAGFIRNHEQHS